MNTLMNVSSRWALSFVLLLVCVSYSNTLSSPLVLDDIHTFVEEPNVYLKNISLAELGKVTQTRFGMARLVPMLTFALDHYWGKGRIASFHLTNIVIHLLAVSALFVFLRALLRAESARNSLRFLDPGHFALFACALWVLNPVQTNAVTYVVQRMTSLAALFYILSLACYVHGRLAKGIGPRVVFFLASLLAAVLAFLSKENSATLPLAILLLECVVLTPGLAGRILGRLRWYHWVLLLLFLLAVLPLGQHPWQVLLTDYEVRDFTLSERLYTQLRVVVFYISLLLLPLPGRLNLDHDFAVSTGLLSPPVTLLAGSFLLGLLVAAFFLRKRSPLASLGIFWFFLHLVIESSVVGLELVFEHRLYLPSVGLFIVLVVAVDRSAFRLNPQRSADGRKIVFLLMIICATISSLLTTARNDVWRDSLVLYEDCYAKSPGKARTSTNLGMVLSLAGRDDEALVALERAMRLSNPRDEATITIANNILHLSVKADNYQELIARGEEYFTQITRDRNFSGFDKFMRSWGHGYHMTGRYAEALDTYVTGLVHINDSPFLINAIEQVFFDASKSEKGRQELGLSGQESDALLHIVDVMLRMRLYGHAEKYLFLARDQDPGNPLLQQYEKQLAGELELNRIAGAQFDITGDETYRGDAVFRYYMDLARFIRSYYRPLQGRALGWLIAQARKRAPDDPHGGLYQAEWHITQGNYQEAATLLVDGSSAHPDFVPLLEALGRFYLSFGQPGLAAETYQRLLELYPGYPKWAGALEVIREGEQKKAGVGGTLEDM